MLELEAANTHLYPGAKGAILSGAAGNGPVALRFADGALATGTLAGDTLWVRPYTTAAGTDIPARTWRVTIGANCFRITAHSFA